MINKSQPLKEFKFMKKLQKKQQGTKESPNK